MILPCVADGFYFLKIYFSFYLIALMIEKKNSVKYYKNLPGGYDGLAGGAE